MTNRQKAIHWILFFNFLGLIITALSANYFFSKEAILDSMRYSLSSLALDDTISLSDRLFIAKIMRRDTWEIYTFISVLYLGYL